MASSGKIEIEKFNGQSFELWKLKMEDLLVDKDQWIVIDVLNQRECPMKNGRIWIRRQRAQYDCVSQIQYC